MTVNKWVFDARSISVKREYRYFEELSSMISPEVVQMISVLKKTNIPSNSRYFRLRILLIFEQNDNRSTLQWRHIRETASLFSLSMSRITCGFARKGPVMWKSKVRASPNIICTGLIASAVDHPDDIWRHPGDIRCYLKSSGWHNET